MNTWHKQLKATFAEDQIVRIDRQPEIEDQIDGYVVGVSECFVMLHLLDPNFVNLNGYIVLRSDDVRRYRVRDDNDFFLNRALKLKGIRPALPAAIDLTSFGTLLESANKQFPLLTIHRELMDPDICFIGQVEKLTDKTVTLKEIDPGARWERVRRYNFRDITRVEFGGGYEDSLALVAGLWSSSTL